MIRLLVLFGAGLFIGLVFGFGLGRWLWPFRDNDELDEAFNEGYRAAANPDPGPVEAEWPDDDAPVLRFSPGAAALIDRMLDDDIDSPGPDEQLMSVETPGAGPGVQDGWEPLPGDRVYQWAHPSPIRRDTRPITVIDWERVSWADRLALEQWDWAQRMHAWVEDWDRDQLEAA